MEVTNGTVHLLFMEMGGKIIANKMFMSIKSMHPLNRNREEEGQRKNRCKNNLKSFLLKHLLYIN